MRSNRHEDVLEDMELGYDIQGVFWPTYYYDMIEYIVELVFKAPVCDRPRVFDILMRVSRRPRRMQGPGASATCPTIRTAAPLDLRQYGQASTLHCLAAIVSTDLNTDVW
jgi:hypothetical protein